MTRRSATSEEEPAFKPTILQTVGAAIAGSIATRIAAYVVTTAWRLVTREEPPQLDAPEKPAKKAVWVGLVAAATGAARQAARDKVRPG